MAMQSSVAMNAVPERQQILVLVEAPRIGEVRPLPHEARVADRIGLRQRRLEQEPHGQMKKRMSQIIPGASNA